MKILIFSVSTGQGHNATAAAVQKELQKRGYDPEIDDAVFRANHLLGICTDWLYRMAISGLRFFYGIFYRMAEKRKSNSYSPSLTRFNNRILTRNIRKKIEKDDPDIIICTHPFAATALDTIKQKHPFRARCVGIVTDFTMHPFWEEALRLDLVALPDERLVPDALKKGFREAQIVPTGIPIDPVFYQTVSKEEARAALNIALDKKTFLVMSGSMGHGNMLKNLRAIDALPDDFQLIVVCGSNKRMYRHIKKESFRHPLQLYGYTKKVPLMMSAADCMISKPGGLSTSEAMAKALPLIITNPIPGHEERNAAFLADAGAAYISGKKHPIEETVALFLRNAERANALSDAAAKLSHRDAAGKLCDRIEALGKTLP